MKLLFFFLALVSQLAFGQISRTYLFVGTYTAGKPDKGIYIYEFNSKSGKLKIVSSGEGITNPSFLTVSPDGKHVYACTETKLPGAGSVSAFHFDSTTAALTYLNKQNSGGENPVYITTSRNNQWVINANYNAGTVSACNTNPDGSINPPAQTLSFEGSSMNIKRQEKPHLHAVVFSPEEDYVFFPDLGADLVRVFKFDGQNSRPLKALDSQDYHVVPGSGPRHLVFHPNKRFAYLVEELSGTITAFTYRAGKLDSIQRLSSYVQEQDQYSGADIHVSPDGLFLYVSNRVENTIAIFSIDLQTGKLKLVGHQSTLGDHPRNFTLDPNGKFLVVANQLTNNLFVFKRNPKTGLLTPTGKEYKVPNPSCLKMRTYGK